MDEALRAAFQEGDGTRIRRRERAADSPEFVISVIDEAHFAHVAFVQDGVPKALPMAHARLGATLYLHGALRNRALQAALRSGCSLTFTLLDGLVFARTAFHHSMNYRSAVVLGDLRCVDDAAERHRALQALVDHNAPGRYAECAGVTDAQARSTSVLAFDVVEASGRFRTGPPVDDPQDLSLPHWAGVVPLRQTAGPWVVDDGVQAAAGAVGRQAMRLCSAYPTQEQPYRDWLLSSDPGLIDVEWLHDRLSTQSYWASGVTPEALATSLLNSVVFGAYRHGRQFAFARVLTDGSRVSYLADVFVEAKIRGKGLGSALVRFIKAHPAVGTGRIILGTRDAVSVYERLGFALSPNHFMTSGPAPT